MTGEGTAVSRKDYLDVAKLFAVLCVVYVHASVSYTSVRRMISAFFMPVFFIIYGIASSRRQMKSAGEVGAFVEKRMKSLLVPYVLWAMIYGDSIGFTFARNLLIGNHKSLGFADTNAILWFLPCMFLSTVLYQIYINISLAVKGRTGRILFLTAALFVCGTASCILKELPYQFRIFGCDIAFSGCLFMIIGGLMPAALETIREKWPPYVKIAAGIILMPVTYLIVTLNLPYLLEEGCRGVSMALSAYGRYDLFVAAALVGSFAVLLFAMAFEKISIFIYMGRFSLVIMGVHHLVFPNIKPFCKGILNYKYGGVLYPAAMSLLCFVVCIPLCYIVDWACPELNGKSVRQKRAGLFC